MHHMKATILENEMKFLTNYQKLWKFAEILNICQNFEKWAKLWKMVKTCENSRNSGKNLEEILG